MNINELKEFQAEEQERMYQDIKQTIFKDIERQIHKNPNINNVAYYTDSVIMQCVGGRCPIPIGIYKHIVNYQDRLMKEFKEEGLKLSKIIVYETKTKGWIKKKEYKVKHDEYYSISW